MTEERAGVNRFAGGLRPRRVHHVRAPDAGRQWEAAGQGLAEADHIRSDSAVLAGEPFARSPETRVNLIEDQQRAVLGAEAAERPQKLLRRNVDAAARLHRLDEDRADGTGLQQTTDGVLGRSEIAACCGKGNEVTEVAEL